SQTGDVDTTLKAVENNSPDLLLLDNSLPDEGGLHTLKIIKEKFPGVRVVILTIQNGKDVLFDAIRLGVDGYLYKDLSAQEFLDILAGLENGQAAITRETATRIMKGYQEKPGVEDEEGGECLSQRELELLNLVFEGHSNRKIAEELFISENTVKYHIKNILQKLGVSNRTEAVSQAL
ncbi:MAG: response regulator, partial [Gammaproteobacteria bacterium]|nr:response regulator [Gammaproteobacteria bacterium]